MPCKEALYKRFSLSIDYPNIENLTPYLDRWLDLAMEKNVSKLWLSAGRFFDYNKPSRVLYSIPEEVLVVNTLEVLLLHQCKLNEDRFGSVNLPRLVKLSLSKCQFVGESLLQKIVSSCPVVEHISILRCIGVGHFLSVSRKLKLRYFEANQCDELEKIEIDAPNLHTLSYSNSNKAIAIDMSIWPSVKVLELGHVMHLEYLLSKFQCIEGLKLNHGSSKNFKISSASIKRLILGFFRDFPNAKINAPNLYSLEFNSTKSLSSDLKFSAWNVPKLGDIEMTFFVENFATTCEAGLEEFLMKLHNYEDLKVVIFNRDNFILIEKLHVVSFTFLRNMIKNSENRNILISSRDETRLVQMLVKPHIRVFATMYMICSSPESAESFCKKLGDYSIVEDNYSLLELAFPERVKTQMNSDLREFLKSNSGGSNHHAAIVLHKRNRRDIRRRLNNGRF